MRIIFLFSILVMTQAKALTPVECEARGGEPDGTSCRCILEDAFITEENQTCFVKAIDRLTRFQNSSDYCASSERDNPEKLQMSSQELCKNPARSLCDPKINSELVDAQLQEAKYNLTRFKITQEFGAELKKKTGYSNCFELEITEYKTCRDELEAKINNVLYDSDHFANAKLIFEQTKQKSLNYLNEKIRSLEKEPSSEETTNLIEAFRAAISRVQNIPLRYNSNVKNGAAIANDSPVFCAVHGLIHPSAVSKEGLEHTFAHEIGHVIDGIASLRMARKSDYSMAQDPFQRMLTCELKNKLVQNLDVACLEQVAMQTNTNIFKAQAAKDWLSDRKKHPYISHQIISTDKDQCANNQYEETHADIFAAEITALEMENFVKTGGNIVRFLQKSLTLECTAYLAQSAQLRIFGSQYITDSKADRHPDSEKRINNHYFENPKIRKIIGCPALPERSYCAP